MNTPFLFEASRAIAYSLILAGLLIGFFKFKILITDQLILLVLLIVSFVVELISYFQWLLTTNNNYIYHIYPIAEFLLLGFLYMKHLNGLIKPIYMQSLMIAFLMFALVNTLFFQGLKEFNSNVTFVESLLLIVFAMVYFYKLLRDLEHRRLQRVPMFWINMSVLTYFSGALMLFHVANELIPLPLEERTVIWGTHALFNIAHYFLYSVALWVNPMKA